MTRYRWWEVLTILLLWAVVGWVIVILAAEVAR